MKNSIINEKYMEKGTQNAIRKRLFLQQGFPAITLTDFWEREAYETIRQAVGKLPFQHERTPLSHSFARAPPDNDLTRQFQDDALVSFLASVIGKTMLPPRSEALRLTWKDYTIINDKDREPAAVDIFFDFTEDWPDKAGGNLVYRLAEGDFFLIPPQGNTLSIIRRKGNVQRFFQYINHYGKGKERILVRILGLPY